MMGTLLQDLRYGLRVLLKAPGFTTVAVLSLAVGIGANTTTFSWIDGLLLRPLSGVEKNQELVSLQTVTPSGEFISTSYPDYRDFRDQTKLLSGVVGYRPEPLSLSLGDEQQAEPIWVEMVTGNFFEVLGVKPALGRVFVPEEWGDKPGAYPVVVISHGLWKRRFRGDPGVVGKQVQLNRQPFTVIGVAPKEFHGAFVGVAWDLWVPLMMERQLTGRGDWLSDRSSRDVFVAGRLKPGVAFERARAEIETISQRLAESYPDSNRGTRATIMPMWKAPYSAPSILGPLLKILMGVSAVVLLIVCANVANLLLARATSRQREFSIRLGLGASRMRLIRQLLTESLLVALAGAAAGILLASWMTGSLLALAPVTYFPLFFSARLDSPVLGFTVLLALLAGVLFGLAPALEAVKPDLSESLKSGGRSLTATSKSQRLRRLLVVSEVALALVALVGAGLFVKSFQNARKSNPGFDPQGVMLVSFNLRSSGYDQERGKGFYHRLRERLEATPGVESVSYAVRVPLGFEGGSWEDIQVEGYVPRSSENMKLYYNKIAPGYFQLMRIPVVEGRDFTERDDEKAPPVVIVNQAFIEHFLAGRYPIGRQVRGWDRTLRIVGVVKTSKYAHLEEVSQPYLYLPFRQSYRASNRVTVHIRTAGRPESVPPAVRREVQALDPSVALFAEIPLVDYISASLMTQKVAASLLSVLGTLALLLAVLGLYSVMAYSVTQRTHEIGVRMALGAQPRDVLRLVVGQGMVVSLAGVAAGLAAALALTRLMSGLLFRVSATDPLIFAGASLFLTVIALAASYIPAHRATKVDPMVALRYE
jgi:predicted permease